MAKRQDFNDYAVSKDDSRFCVNYGPDARGLVNAPFKGNTHNSTTPNIKKALNWCNIHSVVSAWG
ncbi:MAG: hypothetical protein CTY31_00945 [Hyphomicrobium sp.]|nr:MAG: hypothetical protein CTY39_05840 [Hyphomicrobium sp.]PPD01383.1 MAG: hypothetical protein CTY31_00945 [Hyphomicrobium sp.]